MGEISKYKDLKNLSESCSVCGPAGKKTQNYVSSDRSRAFPGSDVTAPFYPRGNHSHLAWQTPRNVVIVQYLTIDLTVGLHVRSAKIRSHLRRQPAQ
jgi:hypothetical protein